MAKPRKEFDEHLKWNVQDLYSSEEDFQKECQNLEQDLKQYGKFKGNILKDSKTLYTFLEFNTSFEKRLERAIIYAHIQNDQDTTDTHYQSMYGHIAKLQEKYVATTSFIVPEILKTGYKVIEDYLKENPKLKEYGRTLKDLFKFKKYTLSDQEEQIISHFVGSFRTPDEVYSILTDADMKFGKIRNEKGKLEELTEKNYREFIESSNRNVRKSAFNKLLTTYGNFKNTYASLLMNEVKNNNKMASVRGYESALSASLYPDAIPEEIYTNLIQMVKQNIKPLSKFWKLKKEALGVKTLHIYDTYAPITKEIKHKYTEEEAETLLLDALSVLGPTYIQDFKKAFQEGWIDFPPNDGKRNGAYCTACYSVHPYVLLSFDGSFNSVSTLAHELGHAMHYYYACQNQNYQDYAYSIFVAEVASQVNQILLSKYLISKTSDVEEKKYLIDDLIQDFKSTIYRQTMFAEFEKLIHDKDSEGTILTHEELCALYYKLNKEYYGKNIVVDENIKYEWERIPHFYMNFYVYQYATAYAAAIKIAMDILNDKENAKENYLKFLSLGCTKDPIESLKVAGVDMSSQEPIEEAFDYFLNLVSALEELYKN